MQSPDVRTALGALCLIFLFLLTIGIPSANATQGAELLTKCESAGSTMEGFGARSWCRGYVVGVAELAIGLELGICVPDGVTHGQLAEVVTLWLKEAPDRQERYAVTLALEALRDAYPCE